MKICVTGAHGFVGAALSRRLAGHGRAILPVVRRRAAADDIEWEALTGAPGGDAALRGCDAVVHLAARVHVMREAAADPLSLYRQANVENSLLLARRAVAAGVRRFVFVSSIKVNGEATSGLQAFGPMDRPQPVDPYGQSKLEAEDGLRALVAGTGMELVVVRPPLVYGPGVQGNFLTLMRWLKRGVPLPLGAVTGNRRSLVALDNLVDLLLTCVDHPAAAGQTFMASDGEDLSTAALLCGLGEAMGRPARLLPVPPSLLNLGAQALGRSDLAQRLLASLRVDISQTQQVLGWRPPLSVEAGLHQAVEGFRC